MRALADPTRGAVLDELAERRPTHGADDLAGSSKKLRPACAGYSPTGSTCIRCTARTPAHGVHSTVVS